MENNMEIYRYGREREYLDALSKDRSLAVVSKAMASRYLGVSVPTIERRIQSGKIGSIQIGTVVCARAADLIAIMKKEEEQVEKVQKTLEKRASEQKTTTYGEIMIMAGIDLKPENPPDRKRIGQILADVSTASKKTHGVLLSVLVHRSIGGENNIGPGFFKLAKELKYQNIGNDLEKQQFAREQRDAVFEAYSLLSGKAL